MENWYISPEHFKIASENGICRSVVIARVRDSGWTVEKAITEPVRKRVKWIVDRVRLEASGISESTYRARIKAGWGEDDAYDIPLRKRKKRKYGDDIISTIDANNIPYNTFAGRIARGWTIKRAMTEPVKDKYRKNDTRESVIC